MLNLSKQLFQSCIFLAAASLSAQGAPKGKPTEEAILKTLNSLWKKKSAVVMDPQVERACRTDRPVTAQSIVTINDHACYNSNEMKMKEGVFMVVYMLQCTPSGGEEKISFSSHVYVTDTAIANSSRRLGCAQ